LAGVGVGQAVAGYFAVNGRVVSVEEGTVFPGVQPVGVRSQA
jgi:hypothetical protein